MERLNNNVEKPKSIFETPQFDKRPEVEKRCAREALMWGFIVQNQFIKLEDWSQYFFLWTVAVHEEGHASEVEENGGIVVKKTAKAEGNTLGSVSYILRKESNIETFEGHIRAGLAGGISAEVNGLSPDGCGFDHRQVDMFANHQSSITGEGRGSIRARGRQRVMANLSAKAPTIRFKAHRLVNSEAAQPLTALG